MYHTYCKTVTTLIPEILEEKKTEHIIQVISLEHS